MEDRSGDGGVHGMRTSQSADEVNIIRGIKAGHKPTFHLLANRRRCVTMQHNTAGRGTQHAATPGSRNVRTPGTTCQFVLPVIFEGAMLQSLLQLQKLGHNPSRSRRILLVWFGSRQRRGLNRTFFRFDPAAQSELERSAKQQRAGLPSILRAPGGR